MALKNRFERIGRGEGARPLGFSPVAPSTGTDGMRFLHVSPSLINRDPTQPRKDLGDLDGLQASIKQQGILQPLIVTPLDEQHFQLVAGERRLTAARQLGLTEVPILVRSVAEHQRLILQIVENLHRKDLSPVEEAEGIKRLIDESALTQRDIGSQLGKSLTYVNELLRLLQLPPDVLDAIRTSEQTTSKSLLLEITKQPDENRQRQLWQQAQSGVGLTVKQARATKRRTKESRTASKMRAAGSSRVSAASVNPTGSSDADWRVHTDEALVIVQLKKAHSDSKRQVQRALQQALESLGLHRSGTET